MWKQGTFLLALLFLTNCNGRPNPPMEIAATSKPPLEIQEGIGGDLAALAVKIFALNSLGDLINPDEPQFDRKVKLRHAITAVILHSTQTKQESLFSWHGEILIVDRQSLSRTAPAEVVRNFIAALGYKVQPTVASRFTPEPSRPFDLERIKQKTKHLLTSLKTANRPFPKLPSELSYDPGDYTFADRIHQLLVTYSELDFQVSNSPLYDIKTKWEVDAICKQVGNGITTVLISASRLNSFEGFEAFLPAILIHETNHVANKSLFGDDATYTMTLELLAAAQEWNAVLEVRNQLIFSGLSVGLEFEL